GVSGTMSRDAALQALLVGTGFGARRDSSGAIAILRQKVARTAPEVRPAVEPRTRPSAASESAREVVPDVPHEIIVTARKREESILKVPVVDTVITGEKLVDYAIADLVRLATRVPGLVIGNGALAIGPQVSLRGVGTSTQDAGVDQSVALNLDGLSIG